MKYFLSINENGKSIVLDDTFKNLELLTEIPLRDCIFKKSRVSDNHGYYELPSKNENAVLTGIGISEISGVEPFAVNTKYGEIRIYDKKSGIDNHGVFPVRRTDIESKAKIYVFGWGGNEPTKHMVGFEIYNELGKVVYSSEKKYLNVLRCGSDETEQINYTKKSVFFTLGTDFYSAIWINHKAGVQGGEYMQIPKLKISKETVEVSRFRTTATHWTSEDADKHLEWRFDGHFCYNYGWLIGNIGERSNL